MTQISNWLLLVGSHGRHHSSNPIHFL